jgi:NTE family protein
MGGGPTRSRRDGQPGRGLVGIAAPTHLSAEPGHQRPRLARTKIHFLSNDSLRSLLEHHIPYQRLEEASIPIHVVATELKSGRAAILSSGPTVPALLASCAIPGVFPPVPIGRREYVDGGVANHTPVTVAIELGATSIYVLPVGYPWLNKEPTNALGMALHALARIVEQKLEADVALNRELADIHVLPSLDIAEVSPADFSHTKELIDWGYKAGRRYVSGTLNGRTAVPAGGAQGALPAGRAQGALPEKAKRPLRLDPSAVRAA